MRYWKHACYLLGFAMLTACSTLEANNVLSGPLLPSRNADELIKDYRSINSDNPTSITFYNKRAKTISVNWIDFRGNVVFYKALRPGEYYTQPTYLTHPWLIKDIREGKFVEGFLPISDDSVALIK